MDEWRRHHGGSEAEEWGKARGWSSASCQTSASFVGIVKSPDKLPNFRRFCHPDKWGWRLTTNSQARVIKTFSKSLLASPNGPTTRGNITCPLMNLFCADTNGPTNSLSPFPTKSSSSILFVKFLSLLLYAVLCTLYSVLVLANDLLCFGISSLASLLLWSSLVLQGWYDLTSKNASSDNEAPLLSLILCLSAGYSCASMPGTITDWWHWGAVPYS